MRRLWHLPVAAGLALAAGGSASAQDGWTGTRLPGDRPGNVASAGAPPAAGPVSATAQVEQSSEIIRDMATCLASRYPDLSRAVVIAPDEDAQSQAIKALSPHMSMCLGSSGALTASKARFSPTILVGMLAEGILRKAGRTELPAMPARQDYAADWTSRDASQKVVEEMAICIAERQPGEVADLLWSEPGNAREAAAMAAVQPSIGPCLAANATLKTNKLGLRVALAKAYYHRLLAPGQTVAGK